MDRLARLLVVGAVLTGLTACAEREPPPPLVTPPVVPVDAPATPVEAPAPVEPGAAPIPSTSTPPTPGDAITEAADAVDDAVIEVVDAIAPDPKPAVARTSLLSPCGFTALVAWETGGRSRYTRLYQRPIWPGASSGATIGIGYDLGHQTRKVILADWAAHPQRDELPAGAGVTGKAAKPVTAAMRHVVTPYALAADVFDTASVPVYFRIAHRAFGDPFLTLRGPARDALVSLVYNRGGSMQGDKRLEMRRMRDDCLPNADYACLAAQMRQMKRVWRGTDIEAGMNNRREGEAALIETPSCT